MTQFRICTISKNFISRNILFFNNLVLNVIKHDYTMVLDSLLHRRDRFSEIDFIYGIAIHTMLRQWIQRRTREALDHYFVHPNDGRTCPQWTKERIVTENIVRWRRGGWWYRGEVETDLGVYARILKPLHPSIRAIAAPHPAAVHTGTG